ncbi:MAG: phosphatase family protein [Frankiales bacterium]|jgi:membrane-associated phospholipid phosphatase|nr:phosphatase family protein [Frankiales bacterium]
MGAAAVRWRVAVRTVLVDAGVVVTGIVVYFGIRGLTAGSQEAAVDHAGDILALEKTLGLDVEAGVQALLVDVAPLTTLANWVYIWGHWPVIVATLIWLALHDRRVFLRLRNAMIASGTLGLCVYTTYPVAPPRLAERGFVDTITEQSNSYRVLQPPAFVNQYAAMPSLHVGWDLCLGLALVAAASTLAVRTIGRLMPGVMAAATILTANHYVLDVIAGAAFGLAGWAIALRAERIRERRQARAGVPAQRASGPPPAIDLRLPAPWAGADRPFVDPRCADAP